MTFNLTFLTGEFFRFTWRDVLQAEAFLRLIDVDANPNPANEISAALKDEVGYLAISQWNNNQNLFSENVFPIDFIYNTDSAYNKYEARSIFLGSHTTNVAC